MKIDNELIRRLRDAIREEENEYERIIHGNIKSLDDAHRIIRERNQSSGRIDGLRRALSIVHEIRDSDRFRWATQ